MNLLAIDTTTDYLSLALRHENRLASFHQQVGQKQAELLLPTLTSLLQQSGSQLAELDAIVFTQGPGSFTGIRIGCAIAQGLALAHDLPLIPVPTLDCIAIQAIGQPSLVCLDARMEQVYYASYDAAARLSSDIRVGHPQDIARPAHPCQGIGDGFSRYGAALLHQLGDTLTTTLPQLRPDARALLTLADSGRYPAVSAENAEILYIRNKIALTVSEQKARQP